MVSILIFDLQKVGEVMRYNVAYYAVVWLFVPVMVKKWRIYFMPFPTGPLTRHTHTHTHTHRHTHRHTHTDTDTDTDTHTHTHTHTHTNTQHTHTLTEMNMPLVIGHILQIS